MYTPDEQLKTYSDLVDVFKKEDDVLYIIQRGSLAKNEYDRASDLDLLLVVRDETFEEFLLNLKKYLSKSVELLVSEGWVDTIVPDFGGIGFVYFIKKYGKLIQLDVYATPLSGSKKILDFSEKKILYSKPEVDNKDVVLPVNLDSVKNKIYQSNTPEFQVVFEVYLMAEMYAKHIYRGNNTLALKYRYGLIESIAILLRTVYTPKKVGYKMYDWAKDFNPLNLPLIKKFERNIVLIDIFSESQLQELLDIVDVLLHESNLSRIEPNFRQLSLETKRYIHELLNPTYI